MQVIVSHKEGNSPESMVLEARTSKSSFEIKPSVISPVEYFLAGAISCSATDIVMLPKNQGYQISEIEIVGDVIRNEAPPRKFNEVHLRYSFKSNHHRYRKQLKHKSKNFYIMNYIKFIWISTKLHYTNYNTTSK